MIRIVYLQRIYGQGQATSQSSECGTCFCFHHTTTCTRRQSVTVNSSTALLCDIYLFVFSSFVVQQSTISSSFPSRFTMPSMTVTSLFVPA
mmetsp:Transcript_17244/g.41912  ORF Transcript_17244/g.41912 Transcript_17244/m.41912 type:complete len:91 (-) Transcript_17244:991-1263(-)